MALDPDTLDRITEALRVLIREEFPQLTYAGTYQYTIQTVNGTTVDVAPVDTSPGLPALTGVPLIPTSGCRVLPTVGTECTLVFLNNDPSRPRITSIDGVPTMLFLAGGANFVALANLVSDELSDIATALTAHTHTGVTTGLGTSGPSSSTYSPGSVAATLTKAT